MRFISVAIIVVLTALPALADDKVRFGGAIMMRGELKLPFKSTGLLRKVDAPLRHMSPDTRAFFERRLQEDPDLRERLQPSLWTIVRDDCRRQFPAKALGCR